MAAAKPQLLQQFVLSAFLLCLCYSANGVQCFKEKKLLKLQQFRWRQHGRHAGTTTTACLSHKSRREKGAAILEIKHRDGCSGTGKIVDWNKKQQKRLVLDDVHVRTLQSGFKNRVSGGMKDVSDAQILLTSGARLQTLNYIVTVELGGRNMTLIVDTGSDLTWVQCQPCKLCYNQQEPLFNPSASSSYKSVLCNSSTCQSLQFDTGNPGACGSNPMSCNYVVKYGDGSYTRGELGSDRLSLGTAPVTNFVFGCGRNNKGLFGGTSGLMGLGRSESVSVVSQTSALFGGVFSYCLPTTESTASGSLIMGGDASIYKNSTPISYTRMVNNPQLSSFYFLNLTGISIGGVALQASSFASGGILIDSGTVISRLPPSVYKAVKTEFLKQFSGYPTAPGFSILDTCFNLSAYQEVNIPTLKFHYEGDTEMNVDVTGIFYLVQTDGSQICLALASLSYEDEIAIIGNYQQKNQRVIYNTKDSKLGFAKESCSFT
ncbi:aspartyl protease family protein At5g10770 [Pyrus x bretschneideri]|uniref:aspartyl protease family protein At5g10770 n=1 Tax=Pyrus x bretschneideri TaxID=225117 RepID=UPI00202EE213|nr:aspartyl protease family protein At5g10770 [Pyrus x bretschneideri]